MKEANAFLTIVALCFGWMLLFLVALALTDCSAPFESSSQELTVAPDGGPDAAPTMALARRVKLPALDGGTVAQDVAMAIVDGGAPDSDWPPRSSDGGKPLYCNCPGYTFSMGACYLVPVTPEMCAP